MTKAASEGLRYDVDEKPPHPLAAALGFQIVLLIVAGIVLVPVIVLRAAGAGAEEMAWAVFAALLVSGAVTILQARPIGPVGAGYVLFMGTSGAFIAVSTTARPRPVLRRSALEPAAGLRAGHDHRRHRDLR